MARKVFVFLSLLILAVGAFAQEASQRYIVQLTGEPAIRSADRSAARTRVRTEQAAVRRAIRAVRMTDVASVDTALNAIIVEGPPGMEAALAALPGVRRVEAEKELKLFLDAALEVHSVGKAWEQLGGVEKAGLGVRVGILDTGIYPDHPAFRLPEGLSLPADFPRGTVRNLTLLSRSSNKIIVARNYDTFPDAFDYYGHGTAVAAAVAGTLHESPRGKFSGVAPYALIGSYKVSQGLENLIYTVFVLLALDDAVNDGMQVLNMSFGSIGYTGASQDALAEAYTNLVQNGIVMVVAAGNSGPSQMTVDDAASAEKVIAVGANNNRRVPAPLVTADGLEPISAGVSSNAEIMPDLTGELVDVSKLDPSGLACDPLPAGSLENRIPLILRGVCNFSVKMMNAQNAGAIAVLLYNNTQQLNPDALVFPSVGGEAGLRIGALFVGSTNGLAIKQKIAEVTPYNVSFRFFRPTDPAVLSGFSSRGPSVEFAIKPDLTAVGSSFYAAGTSLELTAMVGVGCAICDTSGYDTTQGTSFSAPLVAGGAAVLKAARPELTSDDIRSLLINAADPAVVDGVLQPVMRYGAGRMNLHNSLKANLTANPVSVSFKTGGSTAEFSRIVSVKNTGAAEATWRLTVESANEIKPTLSTEWMALSSGSTGTFEVAFNQAGLAPGAYEGFLVAQLLREDGTEPQPGDRIRIPYWYAVKSAEAAAVAIVDVSSSFTWFEFRVFDAAGVPIVDPLPEVTTETPGAAVTGVQAVPEAPGTLVANVRVPFTGATFQIKVGEFIRTVRLP